MTFARLTRHNEALVPEEVRAALHIHPGDRLMYEIRKDDTVILRKAGSKDSAYLKSVEGTLSEWSSDIDDEAYGDL